jgi:hypothetical protein
MSHRYSGLSSDQLEIEKKFRDKSKCITTIKQWHIKNSLQYKTIVKLKLICSCNAFKNQYVNGICTGDIVRGLIYERFQN